MPGFGRYRAPRVRFSPGEADLKAYLGVRALHARVYSPFQGAFEPPCTSDCTFVVISKGPGSTGCEVAMPGFGRN